jgi:hypothetical protein
MTTPEIFVEELAGVYESGPVVKVNLASVMPDAAEPNRVVVCRLVGTVADVRRIAAQILDSLKGDEAAPAPQPETEPRETIDDVVVATVT